MNKVDEVVPGGAPKDPPADPPAPKEGEKEYDELGYEIVKKEGDPPKTGDKPKEDPAKKPEKVENPVTGYGDEPPKIEDPKKPDDKPKDPPTDLEKKLEGLHPTLVVKAKEQIAELGLEGEKLDKFIALKQKEQKEANDWGREQQAEAARQEQLRKASWHKELKEDPVFGGEKYLTNVTRSEKVLDEYLPELKKELTEAKQMLRPSVMRGLARLADHLYPDDKMVQGDPPGAENKQNAKDEKLDPLAFYE